VRVLGLDGAKAGWVVVVLEDGHFVECHVVESFADVVADPATMIGVDTPLGETTPGARAAEPAARSWLGPKHASVFTPPPLAAAVANSYDEAKRIAVERTGKKITKQAWYLLPKMLDVVDHWRSQPDRIREVHPECSFRAMRGDALQSGKKTWMGLAERLRTLRDHGIDLIAGAHFATGVGSDDVVDAAAVAWTANRLARGEARSLPEPPECDVDGRSVAIWY
jgi:predicted RNase H-like nuclease